MQAKITAEQNQYCYIQSKSASDAIMQSLQECHDENIKNPTETFNQPLTFQRRS